jgi:1-acyl-sn-glycerol-3-phosphate acyltransferase
MIKFLFFGMIWASMIAYFYIVNITKVPHNILVGLIHGIYYIYYRASYGNKNANIIYGIQPVLDSLNIKINKYGYLNNNKPTLYICNHHSYIDSLILKSIKPDIKTIAKSDSASEFSIIENFANTILDNWGVILYKRGDKESGQNVRNLIKENIIKGDSILVYPEGTSHIFNGLHHFYPGSFEVAYENNFTIQPITIRYETDITWGIKTEYSQKYHYEMIENSKQCIKFDTNDVNVTFHAPIQANKFEDSSHLLNYVKYVITDEWIHQHHYINQNKIYNNINTQNIYTAVS